MSRHLQRIGIAGPISLAEFRDYLFPTAWRDDLPLGDGGTPVNMLCRELLARGQTLVVFSTSAAVQDEIILRGPQLTLCLGPSGSHPGRNAFRVARDYLHAAYLRERPALLHVHWTYEYALPALITDLPCLITANDAPLKILRYQPTPYRLVRTIMAWQAFRLAERRQAPSQITTVSPYTAQHLHQLMRFRGDIRVIPYGIPPSFFVDTPPAAASTPLRFATVLSGWGSYKNGQAALRAFAIYRSTQPQARLIMYGAAHGAGEAAERWAQQQGLAQGVDFIGEVPHPQLLARMRTDIDILLHPSLEETQSMVLVEAMAAGIPVIAGSRSGAVPWTAAEGKAALLVDMRQRAAIAAAMHRLTEDVALRRQLMDAGWHNARQRFSMATMTDAFQAEYQRLLTRR